MKKTMSLLAVGLISLQLHAQQKSMHDAPPPPPPPPPVVAKAPKAVPVDKVQYKAKQKPPLPPKPPKAPKQVPPPPPPPPPPPQPESEK